MQLESVREYPQLVDNYQQKDAREEFFTNQIKTLRSRCSHLIDAMREANELILGAAVTSSEPDKVLKSSEILTNALANVAKS